MHPQLVARQLESLEATLTGRHAHVVEEASSLSQSFRQLQDLAAGQAAAEEQRRAAEQAALAALKAEREAAQLAFDQAERRLREAKAAEEAKEEEAAALQAEGRAQAENMDRQLGEEREKLEAKVTHRAHVGALQARAQAVCAAQRAGWHAFQDKLSSADCLRQLSERELDYLLVALGRCGWAGSFRRHGVSASVLPRVPESMVSGIVQDVPGTRFGDVRAFCLSLKQLEAGAGLPDATVLAGGTDDTRQPVELWSVQAVCSHFESKENEEMQVSDQLKALGITGAVLLSLNMEDIGSHMKLGVTSALAFQEALQALKSRQANLPPTAAPAAAGRASQAVVQALLGDGKPVYQLDNYCAIHLFDSRLKSQFFSCSFRLKPFILPLGRVPPCLPAPLHQRLQRVVPGGPRRLRACVPRHGPRLGRPLRRQTHRSQRGCTGAGISQPPAAAGGRGKLPPGDEGPTCKLKIGIFISPS